MKTIVASVILCLFALSGKAQAIMTFEKIFFNFDTIPQNSEGTFKLRFTNTGNKPLIISSCKTATSADVCTWDKKPVAPGKDGFITYKFDTKYCGRWNKPVTVTSNNDEKTVIHIKGFVQCATIDGPVIPKEDVRTTGY